MLLTQRTIFGSKGKTSNASASAVTKQCVQSALSDPNNDTYEAISKTNTKANSAWWDHFKIVRQISDKAIMEFVQCQTCDAVLTYKAKNGSDNFKKHSKSCKGQCTAQENIVNKVFKANITNKHKKKMTKAAVTMVALNLCPFVTIAGTGFKEFLHVCMEIAQDVQGKVDLQDLLPHATTISQNVKTYADKAREGLAAELKCILEEHIGVTFTTDMTTKDFTKISYSALTCHYIDSKWKLYNVVMGCKESPFKSHTAENIKTKTLNILHQYNVSESNLRESKSVFVTDNGSGNTGAKGIETMVPRIPCGDHRLNMIITDSLTKKVQSIDGTLKKMYVYGDQIQSITQLIEGTKQVVQYFNQANLQQKVDVTLKSENDTRWSSMFESLNSVLTSYDQALVVIADHCKDKKVDKTDLITCLNKPLLVQLVELLKPFKIATKDLEATTTPTIHLVLRTFMNLKKHCKMNETDFTDMANLQHMLSGLLTTRFKINE